METVSKENLRLEIMNFLQDDNVNFTFTKAEPEATIAETIIGIIIFIIIIGLIGLCIGCCVFCCCKRKKVKKTLKPRNVEI